MILLSSSGTFDGMHVKLTNERAPDNCARLAVYPQFNKRPMR
jgi:hypothetical protein